MRNVARTSLVDSAIEELRREIASGVWPVGTKIPSESQLAQSLGMSRLSVREAVRVLAHAGLLHTRQGDGTYVTATDESKIALRRRLDTAAAMDIIDVRRGLDLVAARLAAGRRTEQDLAAMREALARRDAAGTEGDLDGFADADVDFHLRVADAAHNALLGDLYRSMGDALRDSVRDQEQAALEPDSSHADLLQAIADSDAARAVAVCVAILDRQERGL
ncbi:FadR family transcriptional regulator [Nonomuraea sp. KC401]|uniref:FadR family transcriptional regulator n=1 Tax=Nonomuraea longispora TaxID=1848320 RepID=A0A4R4NMV4_9ACTN|nr:MULTISPECIES: FCD domain-containing protein [Nonomuraea]NBE93016.1 FCD domain-containing protein [Nonomuraea sp. K271]TDC09140.1 FadR family transcriptional regulator [Nonomuraea longispora]TLF78164.1 FadR family transcriptional regulator [Nonomuraea sp. KC401]